MGLVDRLLGEWRFARDFLAENRLRDYVDYRVHRVMRRPGTVGVNVHGETLRIRPRTPDLRVARTSLGGEFAALTTLLPVNASGVIIDAGGYIGTASLAMARMFPQAKVITLEAASENYQLALDNTRDLDRIEVRHTAVVAEGGPETLALRNRGTAEWGFSVALGPTSDNPIVEEVPALSMQKLLEELDSADILALKMDIEGAEKALLEQAPDWLDKVPILMIELHERIVPGCEEVFWQANTERTVIRLDGEKYLSIGQRFYERDAGNVHPRPTEA
ncbi:MAG: FkbM family methyltransferase [Pseudomonadota bacterium]